MEEKIDAMLQKYSNEQIQVFIFNFFKIRFSSEELEQIMPLIRTSWREGTNPETRDEFLKKIEALSSKETMKKIYQIMDLVVNYYGFQI